MAGDWAVAPPRTSSLGTPTARAGGGQASQPGEERIELKQTIKSGDTVLTPYLGETSRQLGRMERDAAICVGGTH